MWIHMKTIQELGYIFLVMPDDDLEKVETYSIALNNK
jgi:hypothetical protein